jgi:hypothetical protein
MSHHLGAPNGPRSSFLHSQTINVATIALRCLEIINWNAWKGGTPTLILTGGNVGLERAEMHTFYHASRRRYKILSPDSCSALGADLERQAGWRDT